MFDVRFSLVSSRYLLDPKGNKSQKKL